MVADVVTLAVRIVPIAKSKPFVRESACPRKLPSLLKPSPLWGASRSAKERVRIVHVIYSIIYFQPFLERHISSLFGSNARKRMLRLVKCCFAVFWLCFGWPCHSGIVYHVFTQPVSGTNTGGAHPAGGLVSSGGVLYGTTVNGGTQGAG